MSDARARLLATFAALDLELIERVLMQAARTDKAEPWDPPKEAEEVGAADDEAKAYFAKHVDDWCTYASKLHDAVEAHDPDPDAARALDLFRELREDLGL